MVAAGKSADLIQYVNLNAVINQEQLNPVLRGGEVIHIPESRQILVMGEVAAGGIQPSSRRSRP